MTSPARDHRFFPPWFVPAVLVISLALRVALALQGGQYFFGDEGRYDRGVQLYQAIAAGDLAGIRDIAGRPEHTLFPWVGAAVTVAQHALAHLTPFGDWTHPENISFTKNLAAAVLALFSALNVWLVHRLARILSAEPDEAAWALLLMAASNTAFYFARHLLPYEVAISALLGALCLGLRRPTLGAAIAGGLLTGVTYHLYNGYWFAVPVAALGFWAFQRREPQRGRLAFGFGGALLLALALPVAVGRWAGGPQYFTTMGEFSRSATQGLFAEGWSLPWAYFWHSEGSLGVAVVLAIGVALVTFGKRPPRRIAGVAAALLGAYGLLVLASVGLERFVVYARTVKPLVPAFCLLGGWSLAQLLGPWPRLRPVAAGAIGLAAAVQFWPHFTRVFPREIELEVLRTWGNPKHTLSVSGSIYIPLALPVTRGDLALVNCQMLYPLRDEIGYPPGQAIFTIEHPLTYLPFQYESHTPRERAFLRSHDISIRLIRLARPGDVPADLPMPWRFQTKDRPTGR